MPLTLPPPPVTVVIDRDDDALHMHTALAAHHPPSGRITLHPGPGTTSKAGLAPRPSRRPGKPPLLPGRFPGGRQPAWEAAAAWVTALPVIRLTVLRAHRLADEISARSGAQFSAELGQAFWVTPADHTGPGRVTDCAGWSPASEPSRTSPAVVVAGRHG